MKLKSETLGLIDIKLLKDKNPRTVRIIEENLPLKGKAQIWGQEVYFSVGIEVSEENSQEEVDKGSVAFWPSGNAICIFFGPTPMSTNEKPKAAGPVNVFGKVAELGKFGKVNRGETITIVK